MKQFFETIPKPVLIIGIMLIGAFLAWQSEPPKDYCDNQVAIFTQDLEGVLYPKKAKVATLPPKFKDQLMQCRLTNSLGGCLGMFESLRKVTDGLKVAIPECQPKILANTVAMAAMQQGMAIMAEIAWGEAPPSMGNERFRWLEVRELKLFCEMQEFAQMAWAEEPELWGQFQNKVLSDLIDVKKVPREEVIARSIFSIPCHAL